MEPIRHDPGGASATEREFLREGGFERVLVEVRDNIVLRDAPPSQVEVALAFHRLYLAHRSDLDRIRQALAPQSSAQQPQPVEDDGVLESEQTVRLAFLRGWAVASEDNANQLHADLLWFIEHPTLEALEALQDVAAVAGDASDDIRELLVEAQQSAIDCALADPPAWRKALDAAGPRLWRRAIVVARGDQQRWLATELITYAIQHRAGQPRGITGGTLSAAARAAIAPEEENALLALLASADEAVRGEAVYALGEAGGATAVPALVRVLNSRQETPDMRTQAAVALGRIGGPASVAGLLQSCQTDDSSQTVRFAVFALRSLLPASDERDAAGVRALLEQIHTAAGTDIVTRAIAADALGRGAARPD